MAACHSISRTKALLEEIDKFAYLASIIGTIILAIAFLLLWQPESQPDTGNAVRAFAISLIPNFIAVLVLFAISYTFFRRIQTIKAEHETEETAETIANKTNLLISGKLEEMEERLGLAARFITDLPKLEAVGDLYREATKLVEQADKEILMLWHHKNLSGETIDLIGRTQIYERERANFYETLLLKCRQHSRDALFYRRVLQFEKNLTKLR